MVDNLFSTSGGLSFPIAYRHYGLQDKGVSPGGAQDQLSFSVAYKVFENPKEFQAIEMLYPAKITALKDMLFMVCGANYQKISIVGDRTIVKDCIYKLSQGQTLIFNGAKSGFRTLVFAIKSSAKDEVFIRRVRSKEDGKFVKNLYSDRMIRVIKGPEYNVLSDNQLFEQDWVISQNSSQMGLVLDGEKLAKQELEMISQPVTDGTVQLSPNGPIVLMRHRQTVGGYPRVANVIESDISKLSQFAIDETFRFKLINIEDALNLKKNAR